MNERSVKKSTRRRFLTRTLAVTGAMPLMSCLAESLGLVLFDSRKATAAVTAARPVEPASPYGCLSRDEAAFVEALVNALCPADRLTPDGVTCGLASFIDRRLAGSFGASAVRSTGTRREMTGEQFFKAGVAAADRVCEHRFGVKFSHLSPADAKEFLRGIAGGNVKHRGVSLDEWWSQQVDPLLLQACFTGPIYEPYHNRVFWKMFGHSGDPGGDRLL